MKQNVSPAVMAAIIVVFVAIVGFVGYKLFLAPSGNAAASSDMQAKYKEMTKNGGSPPSKEDMAKNRPAGAGMGYPGRPGMPGSKP